MEKEMERDPTEDEGEVAAFLKCVLTSNTRLF